MRKVKIRPQMIPTGSQRPDEDYFFLNPQYRGGPSTFPFDVLGEPDLGHWKWVIPVCIIFAAIPVWFLIYYFQTVVRFELRGADTALVVTDCEPGVGDPKSVDIGYNYEVNGTQYHGTDEAVGHHVECVDFPKGMTLNGQYLPSAPAESRINDSHVESHEGGLFLELLVVGIMLVTVAYFTVNPLLTYTPRAVRDYLAARRRYRRLLKNGVIIDGTLTAIHVEQQKDGVYEIVAQYQVHDPITWAVITGTQRRNRDDLTPDDLPPPGTPVQIMYAGPDAHFML